MSLYIVLSFTFFILAFVGIYSSLSSSLANDSQIHSNRVCTTPVVKTVNVVACLALGILWFITAFRSENIGNDTKTYIYYFNIFAKSGVDFKRSFEIGYQALNVLIAKFTRNPHIFLIIIASILYGASAILLRKYSKNILVSLCLFYCVCFSIFANTFRQGIAMVIAVFGFYQLKNGKKLKAALFFAIAVLFHTSAVICFLLFIDTKVYYKKRIVLCLTGLLAVLSMQGVFNAAFTAILPRYANYFVGQYASSGWLAVTYELVRNIIFYLLISQTVDVNKKSDRLLAGSMMYLLLFSALGYSVNLFTRASEYFLLIAVIELPSALYSKKIKYRRFWMFLICTVMLLMFVLVLVFRPNWNHLYPYEFWGN